MFRITWPDATVQDLAYALRDGVLLCHLVHSIDPGTIDMKQVNQRPSLAQFLCLKNIRLFLSTLTGSFEMSETDLFQPSMLYDYSDFAQVASTICFLNLIFHNLSGSAYAFKAKLDHPRRRQMRSGVSWEQRSAKPR